MPSIETVSRITYYLLSDHQSSQVKDHRSHNLFHKNRKTTLISHTHHAHCHTYTPIRTMNPPGANSSAHDIPSEIKAILDGLIGGGKYGMKIRLPHAAVMTLLFRRNTTAKDKLRIIFKSTFEHSKNLASFAAIYKVSFQLGNFIQLFFMFSVCTVLLVHWYKV